MREQDVQNLARLKAAKRGDLRFRNNVGATYTRDGTFLRYGLCNDSKKLNDVLKSSDLIGGDQIVITPEMVGTTILQFVAEEIKPDGWKYKGTPREIAQKNYIELINSKGGRARFIAGEKDL